MLQTSPPAQEHAACYSSSWYTGTSKTKTYQCNLREGGTDITTNPERSRIDPHERRKLFDLRKKVCTFFGKRRKSSTQREMWQFQKGLLKLLAKQPELMWTATKARKHDAQTSHYGATGCLYRENCPMQNDTEPRSALEQTTRDHCLIKATRTVLTRNICHLDRRES